MKKLNYIYKNQDGEYFKSIKHNGEIVLSNPSYPFFFKWEVLEPLTLVGSADQFEHLLKKEDYQFHEGDTLKVEVGEDGLKIVK